MKTSDLLESVKILGLISKAITRLGIVEIKETPL